MSCEATTTLKLVTTDTAGFVVLIWSNDLVENQVVVIFKVFIAFVTVFVLMFAPFVPFHLFVRGERIGTVVEGTLHPLQRLELDRHVE